MKKRPNAPLGFLVAIGLLLFSCKPQQTLNQNYFSQGSKDSSYTRISQSYETRIQKRDRLSIYISALNPTSALIFNPGGNSAAGQGYSVDENGNILLPQLGVVHVEGLSKNQLRDVLLKRLDTYLKDPIVLIEFVNAKITVLGEVLRQGPIPMNDQRITILDVLGQAGDITSTGRRDSVVVIRENGAQREFGTVNLLKRDALNSPYFMLQQNDVVYVPMTKKKYEATREATGVQKALTFLSAISSLSSLIYLIYSITR